MSKDKSQYKLVKGNRLVPIKPKDPTKPKDPCPEFERAILDDPIDAVFKLKDNLALSKCIYHPDAARDKLYTPQIHLSANKHIFSSFIGRMLGRGWSEEQINAFYDIDNATYYYQQGNESEVNKILGEYKLLNESDIHQ
jgi:hypothetical protein